MTDKKPSLWLPIQNRVDLSVLGKLGEELCEAGTAVCRSIIQGLDGINPSDGEVNINWLVDEMADVLGMLTLASQHFEINMQYVHDRAQRKLKMKREWLQMIRDYEAKNA